MGVVATTGTEAVMVTTEGDPQGAGWMATEGAASRGQVAQCGGSFCSRPGATHEDFVRTTNYMELARNSAEPKMPV